MANATAIVPLSGSTQFKGIKVVQTGTVGTAIHTTGISATIVDRITLYAYNGHTADVVLTVEFGGVTVPDNTLVVTVPFKSGLVLVVDALPLVGSGAAGLVVGAFAGTANVITLTGFVLRVTP